MADDPRPAHGGPFVPEGFTPPSPPRTDSFWLEPLGPQHNAADYAAWTSSMEHIHSTPGFEDSSWPEPMTADANLDDLLMHADHFERRAGFTYTVRSTADDDVIGCVYIYPSKDPAMDVQVRSWVRVSHAELDRPLWDTVSNWLSQEWPFRPDGIVYAARP
ncbi:MAG TPA: N-acetyltransferase [Actinomycetes bacterium]|nr:N-acetyltransferase [Actinomycetes bacterium]